VINNTVHNNSIGYFLYSAANIYFINNSIYNNSIGYDSISSSFNELINNIFGNNTQYGIQLQYTISTNITQSDIYNSNIGILVFVSDRIRIKNTHLYNNQQFDLLVSADDNQLYNLSILNLTIDNPSGNYQNYTVLDIEDIYGNLLFEEAYGIKWSGQPSALPSHTRSFMNKYVNITPEGGVVNIDKITWRWFDSELSGYNEQELELWKYNSSGWRRLNSTPNVISNQLSLKNINPLSTYAILENTNCPVITSPGTYVQTQNYTGAPNPVGSYGGYACVYIQAENVTFDCNNYYIKDNGTLTSYGVFIDESSRNVTVKNCNVLNYDYAMLALSSEDITIFNNTLYLSEISGFLSDASSGLNISSNHIFNNTFYGIHLLLGTTAHLANNLLHNNDENGIYIESFDNVFARNVTSKDTFGDCLIVTNSQNISIENSLFTNCSDSGVFAGISGNVTIVNSTVTSSNYGIRITSTSLSTIIGNRIINNSGANVYLSSAHNNVLINNTLNLSQYGINFLTSSNNTLINNTIIGSSVNGIKISALSTNISLSDNSVCFNALDINNLQNGNTGAYDRCDRWYNWYENGLSGCTYTCSRVWHRFFGNVSGTILLARNDSWVFYRWLWKKENGGKVYAINGDASINWASLVALGRSTLGTNSTIDFNELDILLNMSGERDSITKLYAPDGSNPLNTQNISLYGRLVPYIPVANSSTQTDYKTGIVWDSSQGVPEFNITVNQDVAFVSVINGTRNPNYDIRVPSNLDSYKGSSGVVEFWLELD
ncbi:MAG: right-handed parallel beta-helix repeat-containing protein, partial [Candidatus Micrarchaeia archaeon]